MPRKQHPCLGDREWLRTRIEAGRSQVQIAEEAGLGTTTMSLVGYYVKKHGLQQNLPRSERAKIALAERYPHGRYGPNAGRWKGGRVSTTGRNPGGYIRIYKPEHPNANRSGYVYEHRYVMEQKIGRLLKPGEVVDHIDRNRSNNAPENLRLHESRSQHVKDHFSARDQLTVANAKLARYEALYGPLPSES